MKKHLLAGACLLGLAACQPNSNTAAFTAPVSASAITNVLSDVQLFCQVGPLVSAMATVSGSTVAPVIAKGASSIYVRGVCAAANGVAVSPPANSNSAPVLIIPATRIPLAA